MIFEYILNGLQTIFFKIFGWINIPSFSDDFVYNVGDFFDILANGANIVFFFINKNLAFVCLGVVLVIVSFEALYKLIMFIIKKIPALSIR